MAGFQTASLMVSDHPVLYGTTLAISLVGSVAALSPSVISVPVARVEYPLSLAERALAAVTTATVMDAAEPAAVNYNVVAGQAELPIVKTPARTSFIPAERHLNAMPMGLAASQPSRVQPGRVQPSPAPKLAMTDLATGPQQELKAAPQAFSPATAAVQSPQRATPVAAPASAAVPVQPGQDFVATFQAMPAPALAVAAERHDEVRNDGTAGLDAPTLSAIAAPPAQGLTASAPVPTVSPAVVQTLTRVPEAAVALDPVASKLTAPSGALPAATSPKQAAAKPALAAPPLRLINSPQLRKFDLARIHIPPRTPTAALGPVTSPATAKSGQASQVSITRVKDRLVGGIVFHQVAVTVAGSPAKALDVRIGADMIPSIRIGDLLGLVSDRMDPASAARFAASASAGEYVSLAALRASGFNVSYNAGADSISIAAAE